MRKRLGILLVVVAVASSVLACALSTAAPDLPAGVKGSQWRSLGPDLGVVIRGIEAGHPVGQFMYKVNGKWLPLALQNPVSVVPAQ